MAAERWFDQLGAGLSAAQAEAVATMLDAHPLGHRADIAVVAHWHEALAVTRAEEHDNSWWDFEEQERERLWECSTLTHTEDELLAALGAAVREREQAIDVAVRAAMTRLAIADPAWGSAARAAARMAIHQQGLASIAKAPPTHPFALKYLLFATGRWPLGLHAGRFMIY